MASALLTPTIPGQRLVVLGGGISGLSFVHYLRNFLAAFNKRDIIGQVTVLEANDYMGGSLKSSNFEDGVTHELGPRTIRAVGFKSDNTLALLDRIGLTDKVLPSAKSAASSTRYIYTNDRLWMLPKSLFHIGRCIPGTSTRFWAAIHNDWSKAPRINLDEFPHRDPSIYDFFKHRFGPDAAEKIVDPIMRGITAGDARNLSTRALFEDLLEKEQKYGSILKSIAKPPLRESSHDELFKSDIGNSALVSEFKFKKHASFNLMNGLQTIPEYLSNSLLNSNEDGLVNIYNQSSVVSLKFDLSCMEESPCSVEVVTVNGENIEVPADHIVSALPSKDLAALMPEESIPEQQKDALKDIFEIPHVPVGCVCFEFRDIDRDKLPNEMRAFGFLTHSQAGRRILGISYDSMMFPNMDFSTNSFRMTCMMGGAWFEDVFATKDPNKVSNAQLEQIALEEIRDILKFNHEPFRASTWLWKTGIAQYRPGHKERIQKARDMIKNMSLPLTLIGQSYDGISVNDVIFSARKAAYDFVSSL